MTKQPKKLPNPRFLKIGYQYYESQHQNMDSRDPPRKVPFLRLSGDWLQAAGFAVGQKARVQVTAHGIMIVVEK